MFGESRDMLTQGATQCSYCFCLVECTQLMAVGMFQEVGAPWPLHKSSRAYQSGQLSMHLLSDYFGSYIFSRSGFRPAFGQVRFINRGNGPCLLLKGSDTLTQGETQCFYCFCSLECKPFMAAGMSQKVGGHFACLKGHNNSAS